MKSDGLAPMENIQGHKRGFHSEFVDPSWHLLVTLNVGKSRVQAADRVTSHQVPLTRYEDFWQELQTYPVSREPVTVQPMVPDNNSALLDLPNLPPPLIPQQQTQVDRCTKCGIPTHTGTDRGANCDQYSQQ